MSMQSVVLAAPFWDTCLLLHIQDFHGQIMQSMKGLAINCCLCKAVSAAEDHAAI